MKLMSPEERELLDEKLSYPFKRWDIIVDAEEELIGKFEKIAYHWWNPEWYLWRYIFADFSQAISKQWREIWEVLHNSCGDDGVYINRKRHKLSSYYRFATDAEKQLFHVLIENKKKNRE